MAIDKKNNKNNDNKNFENEEVSRYGEFITSYFAWLPLEKQKNKADEMDGMTKK